MMKYLAILFVYKCFLFQTIVWNLTTGINAASPGGSTDALWVFSSLPETVDCTNFCGSLNVSQQIGKDLEKPAIECYPVNPAVVTLKTGETTAKVSWRLPRITDNVGVARLEQILPPGYMPGDSFPAGSYTVLYLVEDLSKNLNSCSFEFIVQGEAVTSSPPPTVTIQNCPQSFEVPVGSSGEVFPTWDVPVADNPNIQVSQLIGNSPGSRLVYSRGNPDRNVHQIVYAAHSSRCEFRITLKERVCPAIQQTTDLVISCTSPLSEGAKCSMSCQLGSTLIGPSEVTCKKSASALQHWDWGPQQTPSYCDRKICPTLLPNPDHGSLSCTPLSVGTHCQIGCDPGYDVARSVSFYEEYVCHEPLGWQGDHQHYVPDCTAKRMSKNIMLQHELLYNSNDCSNSTKETLLATLSNHLQNSGFKTQCNTHPTCWIDGLQVTSCQPHSQSTWSHQIAVTFFFKIEIVYGDNFNVDVLYNGLQEQLYNMSVYLQQQADSGSFDVAGHQLQAFDPFSNFQLELECGYGLKSRRATFTCASCPKGTLYNSTADGCSLCPVGTYQDKDAQFNCIQCPSGTTTLYTEAKSIHECLAKCPRGHFSPNGLPPCYICPENSYQDELGQTVCKACPPQSADQYRTGLHTLQQCSGYLCAQNNPCGSQGICISNISSGTTSCHCLNGYHGDTCESPPPSASTVCTSNPCFNGGTCVPSSNNTATCVCGSELTGRYCEHLVGTCPRLPSSQDVMCTGSDKFKDTCFVKCKPGFIPVGRRDLSCGTLTKHQWMPSLTTEGQCVESSTPSSLEHTVSIDYPSYLKSPTEQDKTSIITQLMTTFTANLSATNSFYSNQDYSINVEVTTEVTGLVVKVTQMLKLNLASYFPSGQFQSLIAKSTLQQYNEKLQLYQNIINDVEIMLPSLVVNDGAASHAPDSSTMLTNALTHCPVGKQPYHVLCGNMACPTGTFTDTSGSCLNCPIGTYGNQSGMTRCLPCSEGYTTETVGRQSQRDCVKEGGRPAVKPTKQPPVDNIIPIAAGAGGGAVILIIIIIVVICLVTNSRKKEEETRYEGPVMPAVDVNLYTDMKNGNIYDGNFNSATVYDEIPIDQGFSKYNEDYEALKTSTFSKEAKEYDVIGEKTDLRTSYLTPQTKATETLPVSQDTETNAGANDSKMQSTDNKQDNHAVEEHAVKKMASEKEAMQVQRAIENDYTASQF